MAIRPTDDWRKASKSFQKYLISAGKDITNAAIFVMDQAAKDFLIEIESQPRTLVPYYTGNLMDSIGVRLLKGSRLVAYKTMADAVGLHATKPQRMAGVNGDIWGFVEIDKRIMRPSRRVSRGLVSQLIVGVPYADNVGGDEGEEGEWENTYFKELSDLFAQRMESRLQILKQFPGRDMKFWKTVLSYA